MGAIKLGTLSSKVVSATGLFGGVEAASLLCSVVRTKLVALWIGASGVGLFGIYNSALDMLGALTQMGIGQSAVQTVASVSGEEQWLRVAVVRRIGLLLAMLGMAVMILLSPLLSQISFADGSHILSFCALSVALCCNTLTTSEKGVMQGCGKINLIARSTLYAVSISLVLSVPTVYYLRIESVIPVVAIYSIVSLICVKIFSRRGVGEVRVKLSTKEALKSGRQMVSLGMCLTMSLFVGWLANYILLAYFNTTFGSEVTGTFQAGYTVAVRYAGILLVAAGMEYFPRISGLGRERYKRMAVYMWHQCRVIVTMTAVASALLAALASVAVDVLYSSDFKDASLMVMFGAPALVLRGFSWCVAYTMPARGDGVCFMMCETLSSVVSVIALVGGYVLGGFVGVGIGLIVWYLIYTVVVMAVVKIRYKMGRGGAEMALTAVAVGFVEFVSLISYYFGLWASLAVAVLIPVAFLTVRRTCR